MIFKTPLIKKAHVWCYGTFEINIQYSNECERKLFKYGADSCLTNIYHHENLLYELNCKERRM